MKHHHLTIGRLLDVDFHPVRFVADRLLNRHKVFSGTQPTRAMISEWSAIPVG